MKFDFAKLMEFMRREEFQKRFDAAVAANKRDFGDCAEEVADETREALDGIGLRPAGEELSAAVDILDEICASGRHQALCAELDELSRFRSGSLKVYAATIATATALLLAKTAMPGEETKFLAKVHRKLAPVRALPVLVELASCIIDGELASRDSIRDRAIIDDALFGRRITAIRQVLDGIDVRQL